jgi:hypothetical protein
MAALTDSLVTSSAAVAAPTVASGSLSDPLESSTLEAQAQKKIGADTLEGAIDLLTPASIKHIMAPKHAWNKVVDSYQAPASEKEEAVIPMESWKSVESILRTVATTGADGVYKKVKNKTLAVKGETVELVYTQLPDKSFRISDAWVQS